MIPAQQQEIDPEPNQGYSRNKNRTVKACDTCRTRKLKCDGNKPCSRCLTTKTACDYSYVEKRKRQTHKVTKKSAMSNLENRMSKLEGLLTALVDRLDTSSGGPIKVPSLTATATTSSSPNNTTSPSDYESDDDRTSTHGSIQPSSGVAPEGQKYFGTQSSFSVLSAKGIQWLAKRSGDPTLMDMFISLHRRLNSMMNNHVSRWSDSFDRLRVTSLPPRDVVQPLIDECFLYSASTLITTREECDSLLNIYYSAEPSDIPQPPRLSNSSFLILSSLISLGSFLRMENKAVSTDAAQSASLREIHETFFDMAVTYYHKVSILCEDLKTIQGILLLVLNAEFSPPPVSYMIISTAVRYAQELGLHRKESLYGLSEAEANKRRRLWFYIYACDRDCCLKSGKPPIINDSDVTHGANSGRFDFVSHDFFSPESKKLMQSVSFDLSDPNDRSLLCEQNPALGAETLKFLIFSHFTGFVKFSSEAYLKLFSASALIGRTPEQVMSTIEALNTDIERIKNAIPICIRPGSPLKDSMLDIPEKYEAVFLHIHYHLLRMLVNRMAFRRAWVNDSIVSVNTDISPKQKGLMKNCINSARALVQLCCRIKEFIPLFYYHISFYFFSAFFSLITGIIEDPTSEDSKNDLSLLLDACQIHLEKLNEFCAVHNDKLTYNSTSYFLKIFMKIAISVHNRNNSDKLDTTALDNEISLHDKILTFTSDSKSFTPDIYSKKRTGSFETALSETRSLNGTLQTPPTYTFQHQPPNNQTVKRSTIQSLVTPTPITQDNIDHGQAPFLHGGHPPQPPLNTQVVNPELELYDQVGSTDLDLDKSSNMFQQMFAFPNLYLNSNDLQLLDETLANENYGF